MRCDFWSVVVTWFMSVYSAICVFKEDEFGHRKGYKKMGRYCAVKYKCPYLLAAVLVWKLFNCVVAGTPSSWELRYNLTHSDVDKMEVAHRFCLKHIQSIPRGCRSAVTVVESMVDIYSIHGLNDYAGWRTASWPGVY